MHRSSLRSSQRSRKYYQESDSRKCSVASVASSYVSCVESINPEEFDRQVAVTDVHFQRSSAPMVRSDFHHGKVTYDQELAGMEKLTEIDSFPVESNGKIPHSVRAEPSELGQSNNNVYSRSTSSTVTFADQADQNQIVQAKNEHFSRDSPSREISPRRRFDHQQSDPIGLEYNKKGRRRSSIVQFIRRASSVSNTAYKNIKRALSSNSSNSHSNSGYSRRRSSVRIKHGVERQLIESVRNYVVEVIDEEINDIEYEEEKCSFHQKDIDKIRNTDDMIIRFLLEYFEDHPKASYLDRSCPIHGPIGQDTYGYGQDNYSYGPDTSFREETSQERDQFQRFEEVQTSSAQDRPQLVKDRPKVGQNTMDRPGGKFDCCGAELDEKESKAYQSCIKSVGEAVIETLKWRKEFGVNESIDSEFPKELWTKEILVIGEDSDGATVVYIRGCNYSKVSSNWTPIFVRFLVHESEKILETVFGSPYLPKNPPGSKLGIVIDCTGIGYAQVDFSLTLSVLPILCKHYPQSFSYIWVYEMPWIAKPMLALAMKILPTRHARKLRVIDKKTALSEMGVEGIPKFMGGKSNMVPKASVPTDPGDIVSVGRKNQLTDCDINKMICLYGDKKYYKNMYGV